MKRGTFKKKSFSEYKPLKRTPLKRVGALSKSKGLKKSTLKKVSKQPISKIQKKLWELCRQLIKIQYGSTCYTCGKKRLIKHNRHTGHFIPKAACGAYLKYDLRNLRPQCYNCNINLGGNGAEFYKRLVQKEGQEYVDKLFEDKNITVKAYDHYLMLIDKYTEMLSNEEMHS